MKNNFAKNAVSFRIDEEKMVFVRHMRDMDLEDGFHWMMNGNWCLNMMR